MDTKVCPECGKLMVKEWGAQLSYSTRTSCTCSIGRGKSGVRSSGCVRIVSGIFT